MSKPLTCFIYRSPRKADTYLYLLEKDDFSHLPLELLQAFGEPEFSFQFELSPQRCLAKEDPAQVYSNLKLQGFHLQMQDDLLIEQPDSCRAGCPACSRICPEGAIMFPQHSDPAIAGDAEASLAGMKLDLSQLFGADPAALAAAIGDPQFWKTCYSVFPCGTPLQNDVGSDLMATGDAEAAKAARDAETAEDEAGLITFGSNAAVELPPQASFPLEGGRLQVLGIAWDSRPKEEGGQRWFHLYPENPPKPGNPLHWTALDQNWNHMCAECHSTNLRKNYREADDRFEITCAPDLFHTVQTALEAAGIERGVLMDTNRSWSIDDSRNKFQFGCELGRLIEDGELKGVVRNPNYRGVSATFWRSLSAVGDRGDFEVHGVTNCGKGEPNQMIHVGHASPPCAFRDVEVFGGGA